MLNRRAALRLPVAVPTTVRAWEVERNSTMASHHFSWRFLGIAARRLALALVCSAGWTTSSAFAGASGPTHTAAPIGIPPGDVRSEASGINHSAQAAGSASGTDSEQYSFQYENGATYDLNQLLGNAPYSMTSAQSVNDKGQIATYRYGPKGQIETVLLTPTSIPLPSTPWAALTVVPLMLLARRCRRLMR